MPVRRPVCLICLIFLFVIVIMTGGEGPVPSWDVDAANGKTVEVVGKIVDRQEKNGTIQIFLRDISFRSDQTYFPKNSKGIVVKLADAKLPAGALKMGSVIEARGIFASFEPPRCEGMFDSRRYYMIRGYEGQLKRARVVGISKSHNHVTEMFRILRDRAYGIFRENMSEEDAGLIAAMTLGDRTGLEADIKELYQRVGISHILALSGLHIASVGLALLHVLKKTGLHLSISAVIAFSIIAAYSVMTGLSTSTVRAMIMFGLLALSMIVGRTYDILTAASFSALVILVIKPFYIYDTGFLLSFGAVCAIALVYPILESIPGTVRRFLAAGEIVSEDRENKTVVKIYQSICISLSVMIVTLPIMGYSFMQISLYSVVINLVVIPLMGVVLLTGFSAVIVGSAGVKPVLILKITHYILSLFEASGHFFEKIPGNIAIIGQPRKWQIITYAIIIVFGVITWNLGREKLDLITQANNIVDRGGRQPDDDSEGYSKKSKNRITYTIETASTRRVYSRRKFEILIITIVMYIAAIVIFMIHPRCDLEIRNIDVGQGDCALLVGKHLPTIMMDAGSSDIKQVAKNRIIPVLKANRVQAIDYCFLSHMDSDHVNGVIEMLEDPGCEIAVRSLIVSSADLSGSDNYERLVRSSKQRDVPVYVMKAGDSLCFEATDDKRLTLTCISPGIIPPGDPSAVISSSNTDENDNSLVIKLEYSQSGKTDESDGDLIGLFTGDIGEEVERRILNDIPDCTYLKVAHHGSRNSSSQSFISKSDPEISMISAGVGNSYGHPHHETLSRLWSQRSRIYCTNECGEIILRFDDGKVFIDTLIKQ